MSEARVPPGARLKPRCNGRDELCRERLVSAETGKQPPTVRQTRRACPGDGSFNERLNRFGLCPRGRHSIRFQKRLHQRTQQRLPRPNFSIKRSALFPVAHTRSKFFDPA